MQVWKDERVISFYLLVLVCDITVKRCAGGVALLEKREEVICVNVTISYLAWLCFYHRYLTRSFFLSLLSCISFLASLLLAPTFHLALAFTFILTTCTLSLMLRDIMTDNILFCLVDGDYDNVADLKDAIKTKQSPDFEDIVANKLTHSRFSIPDDKQGSVLRLMLSTTRQTWTI